jgi:hypothetical protein
VDAGGGAGHPDSLCCAAAAGLLLWVQDYFAKDGTRQPQKGAKTVRVHVPQRQAVTRRAVAAWRAFKEQVRRDRSGDVS